MRDDREKGQEASWEELFPEATRICEEGLKRLKEFGKADPEGLAMLKRAADMGYPWGQYKYAISCFYHLDEPLTALRYFQRSAASSAWIGA